MDADAQMLAEDKAIKEGSKKKTDTKPKEMDDDDELSEDEQEVLNELNE